MSKSISSDENQDHSNGHTIAHRPNSLRLAADAPGKWLELYLLTVYQGELSCL